MKQQPVIKAIASPRQREEDYGYFTESYVHDNENYRAEFRHWNVINSKKYF